MEKIMKDIIFVFRKNGFNRKNTKDFLTKPARFCRKASR